MFELSRNIEAVEGCKVLKAVSFVHDCFSEGCHFEEMVTTVPIEREKVGFNKKVFVHDYSNNLYCFNNYCLNADGRSSVSSKCVKSVNALPSLCT